MLKAKGLSNIVITFIERVRREGYECGIYASESNLKTLCKVDVINKYPHWTARWTKTPPSIPTEIWQFGGETNLIRSNKIAGQVCDQNYYMGFTEIITPTTEEYNMKEIKKGSKGNAVKVWQIIVGATPDGIFGAITHGKTLAFQKKHGLTQDGIVGKATWKAGLESLK
jgi:peptidoglycan hydrolase-like protein with peptidoglycan-binding domain